MAKNIIIDYGLGNLFSIRNACEKVGLAAAISADLTEVRDCHLLIMPGVGAFGMAVRNLRELGLFDAVLNHARKGKPLVGICLGMQLLFSHSEEFGSNRGLDLIEGVVKRFPTEVENRRLRIPHIGWNALRSAGPFFTEPFLAHLRNDFSHAYFVHSYYAEPAAPATVAAFAEYQGFRFCAAVRKENIFGMQFHPEKSGPEGLAILENIKRGTDA